MALYLKEQKKTFFHFPKTGGLWFRKVLDEFKVPYKPINQQHDTPSKPVSMNIPFYDSFCFVRKPSEWVVSYWRYRMGGSIKGRCEPWLNYHPCWAVDDLLDDSFHEFVKKLEEKDFVPVKQIYNDFRGCSWIQFGHLQEYTSQLLNIDMEDIRKVAPYNVSKPFLIADTDLERLKELDEWL